MRLFVAVLFFLSSASVSFAAGITSKTADFVIYKNSLGSSTIPIPNWELVVDGNSLAGKSSLPVPKSNKTYDVKLPMPRGKLMSNLAKLARLSPYLFIAQGLIDLYYDESKGAFITKKTPSGPVGDPAYGLGGEIASFVKMRYPDADIYSIYLDDVYCPPRCCVAVNFFSGCTHISTGVRVQFGDDSKGFVTIGGVRVADYNSPDGAFNSLRGASFLYENGRAYIYKRGQSLPQPQPQLEPATETDIVQNLDKNLTSDKLLAVRDLVKSQNWTLETDTIPTVSGPPEVVISTTTRTRHNPDGTTTTEKVVEKNVYTYNGNVITENHVTQVFNNNQLIENNVTEINNETNTEPVDYTFQPPTGEYPTDMKVPEKRDLVADVLNPVASQLQGFGSKIGLRGSGQCSFDIPFSLGLASGSGRLDFCQYQSTFSTLGSMLVAFAYLMAGLIVLGMRH